MKKLLLIMAAFALVVSGCGITDSVSNSSDDGYKKISMTLDVAVGSDGSITQGNACFGQGTIASVLYFLPEGGEPVAQTSTLTVDSVPCLSCYSEITDSTATFPIELSAILDPHSIDERDEDGNPLYMKDELRFWIATPPTNSLNIYYDCGGAPATMPDYGSAVSQIASPFMLEVWSEPLAVNEVHVATRENVTFPPTYVADVTVSIIETLVDSIND